VRLRYDHMTPVDRVMPRMFSIGAMVSLPMVPWASRMYKAEIKGMQQDIRAMQQEREAMLNEAQGMAAGMLAELRNLRLQLDNYQQRIIPALRRNYQALLIGYEQNKGELPVVIDGWESLNMAQMEYLERLQLYYQTLVAYEREVEK
jgi:outer membrane protein, heavy metal efflux system